MDCKSRGKKNYKVKMGKINMILRRGGIDKINRRGQATIFVIIAILIVAAIAISFFMFPGIRETVIGEEFTPQGFLVSCIESGLRENVETLGKQGGEINPEGFVLHNGEKVKYLCYTSKYYETCSVQQPLIKTSFEKELNSISERRARDCINLLKGEYESRGYSVTSGAIKSSVEIKPTVIRVNFDTPLTVTKDETRNFEGFNVEISSKMYDLLYTAQSIINFESEFGDSETSAYMQYYPDLKIEKNILGDGTTIYKLSNVVTKEEFTFASRSLAWPPGFGGE